MSTPIIAIIGSKGKMGSAFVQLLRARGLEVLEADLDTPQKPEEVIGLADIVLFSLPISQTPRLIRELAPLAQPHALITDITSIKSPVLQAMREGAPQSCELLGLHPMFGPGGVLDLSKQVIVVCEERTGSLSEWLLNFFRREEAILKHTTPEEHDKMMNIIQGLTHLSSIATAMALKQLGFGIEESFAFSSPIYRLRLEMVGRILSQSPQLYAEIAIENPLTKDSLQAYQDAIQTLAGMVNEHDTDGFVREFAQAANYLGSFKDDAYQRTNELIGRCKDIL